MQRTTLIRAAAGVITGILLLFSIFGMVSFAKSFNTAHSAKKPAVEEAFIDLNALRSDVAAIKAGNTDITTAVKDLRDAMNLAAAAAHDKTVAEREKIAACANDSRRRR